MAYDHLQNFLNQSELDVLELVPTPAWVFDLGNYKFWWCNAAGLEFWGVKTVQDMIDKDMSSDSEGTRRRMEQVFEKAATLGESSESWTTYPNGVPKTVHMRQRALLLGKDGSQGILAFISEDVDLGKDVENLLLVDATRYTSAMISIFTFDGQMMRQNPAASDAYGSDRRADHKAGPSLFVRRFSDIDEGKTRFSMAQNLKSLRKEHIMITRDGPRTHMVDVQVSRNPLTGNHNLIVTEDDVTQRIQMENDLRKAMVEAKSSNLAKRDFLANMSHELRTPMNGIIGLSHLCLKTNMTPRQADYMGKIGFSAKNLLGIINDILDFSKIEAGQMEIEQIEFDLENVLDSLSGMVGLSVESKGLELLYSVSADTPNGLVGDPFRLGQILVNLTSNAVKFSEQGQVVVATEVLAHDADAVKLRISVQDSGIGLDEDQISKLFKAFSQADTSTTRQFGGTGLGLSISKQLVEMMGGEIGLHSEPGVGSTFFFTLTFGLQDKTEQIKQRRVSNLHQKKILVVDDNVVSRGILKTMLTSLSFNVNECDGGKAAVAQVEMAAAHGDAYDLVIMDLKMPGMDGVEAAQKIRMHSALVRTPIIFMATAYGRDDIERQLGKIGSCALMAKPVNQSTLFDTIMGCFNKSIDVTDTPPQTPADVMASLAGIRVLLTDDNEINRQVGRDILEYVGVRVDLAANGQEAVDAVMVNPDQRHYDAVLMDIQMPVMDGYEATAEIRKDIRFKDLPIIALTAHALQSEHDKCLNAGMNDHVAKPIDAEGLYETLATWVVSRDLKAAKASFVLAQDHQTEGLPDVLPGIDIADGLVRFMGKRARYAELLKMFLDTKSDIVDELKSALEKGDVETATHLAHDINGSAGMLSAKALNRAATALELALASPGISNVDELVDCVVQAHTEVISGLSVLNSPANSDHEGVIVELDLSKAADIIDEYLALLSVHDLSVEDQFGTFKSALNAPMFFVEIQALKTAIDSLNFKVASAIVSRMANTLGMQGTLPKPQEKNKIKTILIVDDEAINIKVLGGMLKGDLRVLCALNGEDAISMAHFTQPDLILLDVIMPHMNGHQVCRRFKDDSRLIDIPIIFITALSDEKDEALGLELGAIDYILKPFQPAIILARIKNHLELKVQRDTLKRLSEELSIEVSELLSAEQEITHLATHDSLTGLPNRTLYLDRLTSSLSATRRTEKFVAILFIDLDGFKAVNDSLGHYMGDELLKSVATKLNACARETDTIARLGGDEFVVLLTNLKDPKFAEKIADDIIKALSVPFNCSGMTAQIGASIGIACSGDKGGKNEDVDGLMRLADGAMYDAKRGGKNKFVVACEA